MRTVKWRVAVASLALVATTATACGGSSHTSSSSSNAAGSGLTFDSQNLPVLKGASFNIGNSAGDATLGDTVAYLVPQILKKWGASTSFQLGNGNNTELAVVSGQMDTTSGPLGSCINAGLTLFGPNQVHVDYLLVSDKAGTVKDLKGKTVALATAVSPDQTLLTLALQQAGLTRSDVHTFISGANSASVSAMVKGAVDAAWVHADALLKLQASGNFHVLASGAETAPFIADTYMCAKPTWLTAHPDYAEAIDLAWITAANTFNKDEAGWVQAAQGFTKGADTVANDQAAYTALQKADPWSLASIAHFAQPDLQKNFDLLKTAGSIKGQGDRPIAQWLDTTPWTKAWAVYQAHTSLYRG